MSVYYQFLAQRRRKGVGSSNNMTPRRHCRCNVAMLLTVILFMSEVLQHQRYNNIVKAFSNLQISTMTRTLSQQLLQQPPPSSQHTTAATHRRITLQPLHALMQESEQREKKQEHPVSSSSSPSSSSPACDENGEQQLQQLLQKRKEEVSKEVFSLHIGRALDTFRKEYPYLLTHSPDYTLYDDDMCLCVDLPTMPLTALTYNSVSGLSRYKMVWDMIHGVLSLMYSMDQSYMSSIKLCHDRVRGNVIRVQWHAVLLPRWQKHDSSSSSVSSHSDTVTATSQQSPPPSSKCHHIDGISVYELDWNSGKIIQHRVEQLVYTNNAQPIMVMDEVMLRQAAKVVGGGIPVRYLEDDDNTYYYHRNHQESSTTSIDLSGSCTVEFSPSTMYNSYRPTSLFAIEAEQRSNIPPSSVMANSKASTTNDAKSGVVVPSTTTKNEPFTVEETSVTATGSSSATAVGSTDTIVGGGVVATMIDMGAFDAKNKSRQKFGLKPLSVEEFLSIENQVEQLAYSQQEAIKEAKLLAQQQQAEKDAAATGPSIFDKVFGSVMKNLDTCETNFDCERPQVCCDYIFAKKCCTSGSPILSNESKKLRYARIPVYGGDNRPFPPQQQYPPPSQRYIQHIN